MTSWKIDWDTSNWYPKEFKSLPINLTIPDRFICPITQTIMVDPVTADDGKIYEYRAINQWYSKKNTSPLRIPMNNKRLSSDIELCNEIHDWVKKHSTPEISVAPAPSSSSKNGYRYSNRTSSSSINNGIFGKASISRSSNDNSSRSSKHDSTVKRYCY